MIKYIIHNHLIKSLLLMLSFMLMVQCDDSEDVKDYSNDINIGVLLPQTGDLAAYGTPMLNGAILAAEQINAAGGVLGKDIHIVLRDSETNPTKAAATAEYTANQNNLEVIIGAAASSVTIEVIHKITPKDVLLISGSSTSPALTSIDDNGLFFRTVPSDDLQGKALAQKADALGYQKGAVLYINDSYGSGLKDAFVAEFTTELGHSVTTSIPFEAEQSDYTAELDQVFADDPDFVMLVAFPNSGGTIIHDWASGGYGGTFIFTDGLKSPDFITNAGASNIEGMIGTAPAGATQNFNIYANAFEARFGQNPREVIYSESHYDAMMLIALAIEQAGEVSSTAIAAALKLVSADGEVVTGANIASALQKVRSGADINYEGAAGPVDFDDNGDVTADYEVWKVENGEIVTVEYITP
jgi:branched-chain amino acid transport system substrate-binding protein